MHLAVLTTCLSDGGAILPLCHIECGQGGISAHFLCVCVCVFLPTHIPGDSSPSLEGPDASQSMY